MRKWPLLAVCLCAHVLLLHSQQPVEMAVVGLTHGHVGWILSREDVGDLTVVAIVEPDRDLAERLLNQHQLSKDLWYPSMDEMFEEHTPEAVLAFGSIYEHLEVVEKCAPRGIHVMVEKPLAVSMDHANKMSQLAGEHGIHLLTNFETSWYPTNEKAIDLLNEGRIGDLRKVVVRDGHKGPKILNISQDFLDWLLDPVLNGGGAITDFGCYGVSLMNWMTKNSRPEVVLAMTQQLQPENNPDVDDDATIILRYDRYNAIIQPSWNWPIGRKDMEIYGETGSIFADDHHQMRVRMSAGYSDYEEETVQLEERKPPYDDPFALFVAVIRNEISLEPFDPYALENNLLVVEVLDAARISANEGRVVSMK